MIQVTLLMLGACTVFATSTQWKDSRTGKLMSNYEFGDFGVLDENSRYPIRATYRVYDEFGNDSICNGFADRGKLQIQWSSGHLAGQMWIRSDNEEMDSIKRYLPNPFFNYRNGSVLKDMITRKVHRLSTKSLALGFAQAARTARLARRNFNEQDVVRARNSERNDAIMDKFVQELAGPRRHNLPTLTGLSVGKIRNPNPNKHDAPSVQAANNKYAEIVNAQGAGDYGLFVTCVSELVPLLQ